MDNGIYMRKAVKTKSKELNEFQRINRIGSELKELRKAITELNSTLDTLEEQTKAIEVQNNRQRAFHIDTYRQ